MMHGALETTVLPVRTAGSSTFAMDDGAVEVKREIAGLISPAQKFEMLSNMHAGPFGFTESSSLHEEPHSTADNERTLHGAPEALSIASLNKSQAVPGASIPLKAVEIVHLRARAC
jgi:hypothetical protein